MPSIWWLRAWATKSKLARQRCLVGCLCYTPAMTQDEFDSLAIFVAVVEELRQEPFFSEDNHEKLGGEMAAVFCHPMFLKSAVLPFRKIWMSSERCAFQKGQGEGIRDLVFRVHPDKNLLKGYRYWFYDDFDKHLTTSFGYGWATESKHEIIDLWLNTQLAHTGPMNFPNPTKKKQFSLADFNTCDARIGREKFEFLFRSSIATVGHSYISFEEILAFPLFTKLRDEQGMKPSFEADVALKYNPYPDPKYKIHFDDVFWHLSRETMEDSFCRLLARQRFDALQHFLRPLFDKAKEAFNCVSKSETLDALLKEAQVTILSEKPDMMFKACFTKNTFLELGKRPRTVKIDVFEGRRVLFYNDSQSVLSDVYIEFLSALKKARRQQRQPDKW